MSNDDIPYINHRRLRWETSPHALLGEGSFGIVYSGKLDGAHVAIKIVKRSATGAVSTEDKRVQESAALKQHHREIHRLNTVKSPHIIQYLGVFRDKDPRDLFIVTEYLEGGSLHDNLLEMRRRRAMLDDGSFLTIAIHIARGLNHVHTESLTHGDMKPQNVLLTSPFQFHTQSASTCIAYLPSFATVKIADFGLSKRLEGATSPRMFGSTAATTDFGNGPVGTYLYMSPEGYRGVGNITDDEAKASDVYAYALVLFELLSGMQSWSVERVQNVFQLSSFVRDGRRPNWGPHKDHIDPAYRQLVEDCWSPNPGDRPLVDDIVRRLEELTERYEQRSQQHISDTAEQPTSNPSAHDDASSKSASERSSCQKASQVSLNTSSDQSTVSQKLLKVPFHEPTDPSDLPSEAGNSSDSDDEGNGDQLDDSDQGGLNQFVRRTPVRIAPYGEHPDRSSPATDNSIGKNNDGCSNVDNPESTVTDGSNEPTGGFVHVVSMRLTESQTRSEISKGQKSDPDVRVESAVSFPDGTEGGFTIDDDDITSGLSQVHIRDDSDPDAQTDEIDSNIVDIVRLRKVESKLIEPPTVQGLQIPTGDEKQRLVYGLGSIAENARVTEVPVQRSETALLSSFFNAAQEPDDKSAELKPDQETQQEETEPQPQYEVTSEPEASQHTTVNQENSAPDQEGYVPQGLPQISLDVSAVLAEPLPRVAAKPSKSNPSSKSTSPNDDSKTNGRKSRREKSYTSPDNVEMEAEVLSEFAQNDFPSTGFFNSVSGNTAPGSSPSGGKQSKDQSPAQKVGYTPASSVPPSAGHEAVGATGPHKMYIPMQNDASNPTPSSYATIPSSVSHPELHTPYGTPRIVPTHPSAPNSKMHGYTPSHPLNPGVPPLSAYQSFTTQGASAPPLSDTSQSAIGSTPAYHRISHGVQPHVSPTWQANTPSRQRPPNRIYASSVGHETLGMSPGTSSQGLNALLNALQRSDGMAVVQSMWQYDNRRVVAMALARSPSLRGESILALASRFLTMNNDLQQERRDPYVAIELCTAIGNIARNDPQAISASFVLKVIPNVLLVMSRFHHLLHQHVEVYSACCFALTNLFMITNVITDGNVRTKMALWIEYAISFNIANDSTSAGPFSDSLAYTATCAARNFMWMNEANVQAFVTCSGGDGQTGPPITHLIQSLRTFSYAGKTHVVQSTLSALALIIYYPRQRAEFMHRHGFKAFFETLQQQPQETSATALIFSMLAAMFSGPVSNPNDSDAFWKAFVIDQGSQGLIQSLDHVRRGVPSEKERLEVLERGFYAVLTVARFHSSLRRSLIDAGCMQQVHAVLRDISSSAMTGVQTADNSLIACRTRLGARLCDVVRELGTDNNGYRYLRENNVRRSLEDMMRRYPGDSAFAHSCRGALALLSY
ncbi:putative serine/threonine-protein kinase roco5 [Gracilariopsis chorda]|uniref:Putative serine/threonine-protein kinase roco5 n=1 Tax=Gracilariopsis chorda TaxID=448386 RepID=A0A2V3IPJ0_9FLOR|nr:putative serine/threonine-protein kinase roco5 [Gracilariopsis chorda]|eukprot:PXF43973.1 putative serine/threonine-protein kinase roco5 [Gracilariopsis chorda]